MKNWLLMVNPDNTPDAYVSNSNYKDYFIAFIIGVGFGILISALFYLIFKKEK